MFDSLGLCAAMSESADLKFSMGGAKIEIIMFNDFHGKAVTARQRHVLTHETVLAVHSDPEW